MSSIDAVSWIALVVIALWVVLHPDEDESTEAPPLRLIDGAPPPGCILPTVENRATGSGIPHAERIQLERAP